MSIKNKEYNGDKNEELCTSVQPVSLEVISPESLELLNLDAVCTDLNADNELEANSKNEITGLIDYVANRIERSEAGFVTTSKDALLGFSESANIAIERAIRISIKKSLEKYKLEREEAKERAKSIDYILNLVRDYSNSVNEYSQTVLEGAFTSDFEDQGKMRVFIEQRLHSIFEEFVAELKVAFKLRNRDMIYPTNVLMISEVAVIFERVFGISLYELFGADTKSLGFQEKFNEVIDKLSFEKLDTRNYIESIANIYYGKNFDLHKIWGIKKPETALYDTLMVISNLYYFLSISLNTGEDIKYISKYLESNFPEIYVMICDFIEYIPSLIKEDSSEYISIDYAKKILEEHPELVKKAMNAPKNFLDIINDTSSNPGSLNHVRNTVLSQLITILYFRIQEIKGTHLHKKPLLKKTREVMIDRLSNSGLFEKYYEMTKNNEQNNEIQSTDKSSKFVLRHREDAIDYEMKVSIRNVKRIGSILIKDLGRDSKINEQTDALGIRIELPCKDIDPKIKRKLILVALCCLMNVFGDSTSDDDKNYKWSFDTGKSNEFSDGYESFNTRLKVIDSDEGIYQVIEVQICDPVPDNHKNYKQKQARNGLVKVGLLVEDHNKELREINVPDYFISLARTLYNDLIAKLSKAENVLKFTEELAIKKSGHSIFFILNSFFDILLNLENLELIYSDESKYGEIGKIIKEISNKPMPKNSRIPIKNDNFAILTEIYSRATRILLPYAEPEFKLKLEVYRTILSEVSQSAIANRSNYISILEEYKKALNSDI